MTKRKISSEAIKKDPHIIWNTYVDLLAMEDEDKLSDIQKIAYHAFWYDSEVQNGGHLQYFENKLKNDYAEVIKALKFIGAKKQGKVLELAEKYLKKKNKKIIETVEEYIEIAIEGDFDKFDEEYASIKPDINNYLEKYLEKYKNEFIEIK